MLPRMDSQSSDNNGYKESSARPSFGTSGRGAANQNEGLSAGLPAVSSWSGLPGLEGTPGQAAPVTRKPVSATTPGVGAGQQKGAMALPWPKQLNSVFNN
jgi:hypothetical protein